MTTIRGRAADEVLFEEVQSFRQPWLWGLMLGVSLLVAAGLAWGFISRPEQASGAAVPALVAGLLWGGLCLFLYTLKLSVRVEQHCLHIRFFPLARRDTPLEDIVCWEARTYRPILEYGGWGIRFSWKGTAYNVRRCSRRHGRGGLRRDRGRPSTLNPPAGHTVSSTRLPSGSRTTLS